MCNKQCRDQNGFKCHISSESHQRQLLIFAENPGKFLYDFSKEFETGFMSQLKRMHGTKRVEANKVYQEYIADKEHIHMNATRWTTLTGFVMYLGRTGKCVVDETEKGWYITWIDRDPDTIARQEKLAKKDKLDKDDEERLAEFIEKQVAKAREGKEVDEDLQERYTEFIRQNEEEKLQLDLKLKETSGKKSKELLSHKSVFKIPAVEKKDDKKRKDKDSSKRKKSALEEIIEEEEKRKALRKESSSKGSTSDSGVKDYWLKKGIVVKIVTKSLGDKYYKQKGYVKEVVDRYAAIVVLINTTAKIKLDQEHLETVIPAVGKPVLVVNGRRRGEEATLESVDFDSFSAIVRFRDGATSQLPYEHFSKLYME